MARLPDWQIGPTIALHPQSEAVQWILDADWYNWSYSHRRNITRDVEASNVIWLAPTRLGVFLGYTFILNGDKSFAKIFITLYDRRIMKLECFQLRTYKEWFADFCSNIEDEYEGLDVIQNYSFFSLIFASFLEYTDEESD